MPSTVITRSAPVRGWNARDSLDQMRPDHAVFLDNFFPEATRVLLRRGHTLHCAIPGTVEAVEGFASGATSHLIAASDGALWNATTTQASELKNGFQSNRWRGVNFNSRLILVNGEDVEQSYDGDEMTDLAITGPQVRLNNVMTHRNRLFFAEVASADFWYGGTNAVQGALTNFPLSRVGQKGGRLVAMTTWTRDGGEGMDDLAVFFMSTGEVIIYAGSDPGDAQNWQLQGVFAIGEPLGPDCLTKFGGDVVAITSDGYVSLGRVLARRADQNALLSDRIGPAVSEQIAETGDAPGWRPVNFPRQHMLVFNYPLGGVHEQHVMNTQTGAWCRFVGLPGGGMTVFSDRLFAGGEGGVYALLEGTADNGMAIRVRGKTAFDYLGSRGRRKRLVAVKLNLSTQAAIEPTVTTNSDFSDRRDSQSSAQVVAPPESEWNEAIWDEARWAGQPTPFGRWLIRSGIGYNFAVTLEAASLGQTLEWFSTAYMFEPAGMV